ncbi:hypothetical protein [Kitasatospora sp. NPDC057223]|uniref:hypothetical protein n=1 Tax=Kitasatospora sp. NPDC057223 TaxID=3346055 RepID=UPI003643EFF8
MSDRRRAVAYLCTEDDPAGRDLCAEWCGQRAAIVGLAVDEVLVDTDSSVPLAERPGWARVVELVATGGVGAVITLNRGMVVYGVKGWHRMVAELDVQDVALLTVGSAAHLPRVRVDCEPAEVVR